MRNNLPQFRPHPLLFNAHLQTIVAAYAPATKLFEPKRHVLRCDDGDAFLVYENRPPAWRDGQRVVLMVHGLGGSFESGYMLRIAEKLQQAGVRVFRKELRGFGTGYNLAKGHCNAGMTEDLGVAAEFVMQQAAGSPVSVVGYSLGGNIVLKWLGELGDLAPANIDSALAVSPPIDLLACARNIRQGMNRIYDWSFIHNMKKLVLKRRKSVPGFVDNQIRPFPRRMRDFDHRYMAPLLGYSGAREYYTRASSAHYLPAIDVPVTILTAADDPIIPVDIFDRHPMPTGAKVHVTQKGGHLGYIAARPGDDPDKYWMDWRVVEWVESQAEGKPEPRHRDANTASNEPRETVSG